jgi:phosphoglycolate phosphatase-like HAD superfamily hydrolase
MAVLGLALITGGILFHPPKPDSPESTAPDIIEDRPAVDIARSYLAEGPPGARGNLIVANAQEIRAGFRKESRDPGAAAEGLTALVSDPSPGIRRRALCHLAALQDPTTVPTLIAAMKDLEPTVRKTACEVLGWYEPPPEVRPALQELAKNDPSNLVRVAAVLTLKANDENAIAVYRLGLENYWLRAECEDALARLGKLELPLPDRMYWRSTASKYEEYLKDRKVKRETRHKGRIYFEVEEDVCSGPPYHAIRPQRFWYRAEETKDQDK